MGSSGREQKEEKLKEEDKKGKEKGYGNREEHEGD